MFNVEDKKFPRVDFMEPEVKFAPMMKSLDVQVRNAPSFESLLEYLPDMATHTWDKNPYQMQTDMTLEDKHKIVYRIFRGKMIPSAMASINITMTINNMSWHSATHLTRHKNMSVSADCSGDKNLNDRVILYPDSFADDEETLSAFKKNATAQVQEYCDIRNSHKFTHVDARLVLPKNMSTFYTVTGSLPAFLGFVRDRKDTQVQPYEDNVMAYRVAQALWHQYPMLATIIDLDEPSYFYRMETQTNFASKFYMPEAKNNRDGVLSENPDDYFFPCRRDELIGDHYFQDIKEEVLADQYDAIERAKKMFPHVYNDLERWK